MTQKGAQWCILMKDVISFTPIGYIRVSETKDTIRNSLYGVKGRIELLPEYSEGLDGIEEFSHIIVIAYLHDVQPGQKSVLKVKPFRKIARVLNIDFKEVPVVGVFCTDSPHRPNPIALTIVNLLERRKNVLYVSGLDLYDGTPVLDIKPYTPHRVIPEISVPEWYISARNKILKIVDTFPE